MVGDDHADAIVKVAQLGGFQGLRALEFQIHQREATIRGLAQHRQLSGDGTLELATIYGAAAGGNEGHLGMNFQQSFQLGQSGERLRKIV